MAPLYGRLRGNRGEVTRTGYDQIEAVLETWDVKVVLTLYPSGEFVVETGEKFGSAEFTYSGDANESGRA